MNWRIELHGSRVDLYTAVVNSLFNRLNWGPFLRRPSVQSPARETLKQLGKAPILIVGAGGSIGSALALRLAELAPVGLILLDASECNLNSLQRRFAQEMTAVSATFRLGTMTDRALLQEIFAEFAPRLVFHAAAFKHVPLLEEQPLAAIDNNIFGTLSLIRAAYGAHTILLSTDKAAQPASIMGATKRVAEEIVLSAGGTALRLCNVLGSRGSVVEVFAGQIAAGGPLTITDPRARRYFITMEEAVDLLLTSALEPESPALLAPALPASQTVEELASFLASQLAPGSAIQTIMTGLRPGEKEAEHFWSAADTTRPATAEGLLSIQTQRLASRRLHSLLAELRAAVNVRDLASALGYLQALVPDYTPSPALQAPARELIPRDRA